MPAASIQVDVDAIGVGTRRLEALLHEATSLPARFQFHLAELVLLRLSQTLEASLISLTCKCISGTQFIDGSRANLLVRSRSMADAKAKMQSYGRQKNAELKWSKVSYIKENVFYVMDPTDPFCATLDRHGAFLAELTKVRNFIAHRNTTSRQRYQQVVVRYYGAVVPVPPGKLLISTSRVSPSPLRRYVTNARAMINDLGRV